MSIRGSLLVVLLGGLIVALVTRFPIAADWTPVGGRTLSSTLAVVAVSVPVPATVRERSAVIVVGVALLAAAFVILSILLQLTSG